MDEGTNPSCKKTADCCKVREGIAWLTSKFDLIIILLAGKHEFYFCILQLRNFILVLSKKKPTKTIHQLSISAVKILLFTVKIGENIEFVTSFPLHYRRNSP